mgnify:CR=1 FL=1
MFKDRGIAPTVVTAIVLVCFGGISFLAMKPELAGIDKSVVLYLLGAWQSLATAAVAYWLGSSNGSAKKDEAIQTMATTAAAAGAKL